MCLSVVRWAALVMVALSGATMQMLHGAAVHVLEVVVSRVVMKS